VDDFDDVIKEFIVESYESLDQLDRDLVALEDAPEDRDRLGSIFRAVHSMKGASGFLALPKLERVAHVGENLLVPLRDGELKLNHDIADGLLGMVDALRDILGNIEANGSEGDTDYEALAARLATLLDEERTAAELNADYGSASLTEDEVSEVVSELNRSDLAAESDVVARPKRIAATQKPHPKSSRIAKTAEAAAMSKDSIGSVAPDQASETAAEEIGIVPATVAAPASLPRRATTPATESVSAHSSGSGDRATSLADSTVRIDVELLNKLMNLVGELVLARNQILQFSSTTEDVSMIAASQRLNLITTELQEGVMKTRMQPISNAWSKLPRVVRDLSAACQKKVEVRMEGAETELDKTILEAIKDPLTHIVRNSVDHGIESPEVRVANGKSPEGTL
jgi:two-component system chemotaxis sensor kinase CheA